MKKDTCRCLTTTFNTDVYYAARRQTPTYEVKFELEVGIITTSITNIKMAKFVCRQKQLSISVTIVTIRFQVCLETTVLNCTSAFTCAKSPSRASDSLATYGTLNIVYCIVLVSLPGSHNFYSIMTWRTLNRLKYSTEITCKLIRCLMLL